MYHIRIYMYTCMHMRKHKYRGKRCPCTYISILQTHIDLYIRIHAVQSTKRWTRYQKLRPTLMSFAKSVRFFPHMAVADQPKLIRTKSPPLSPCTLFRRGLWCLLIEPHSAHFAFFCAKVPNFTLVSHS